MDPRKTILQNVRSSFASDPHQEVQRHLIDHLRPTRMRRSTACSHRLCFTGASGRSMRNRARRWVAHSVMRHQRSSLSSSKHTINLT